MQRYGPVAILNGGLTKTCQNLSSIVGFCEEIVGFVGIASGVLGRGGGASESSSARSGDSKSTQFPKRYQPEYTCMFGFVWSICVCMCVCECVCACVHVPPVGFWQKMLHVFYVWLPLGAVSTSDTTHDLQLQGK